jgi:uncharacterized membrane protein YdjX (TVP38/TMEM64 family)
VIVVGGTIATLAIWGGELWSLLSDQDRFRRWIESYDIYAAPVFVLAQIAQVVIFIIPGEITQVAGGYIFGTWLGFVLNYIGLTLGSLIAFGLGRLFEHAVIELFVHRDAVARFDRLIRRPSGFWSMLVLFVIPGIPKDLLCYVAGMTTMSVATFLFIVSVGRLPGVLLSTIFGSRLAARDWDGVALSAAATLLVLVTVYLLRRPIERFRERHLGHERSEGSGAGRGGVDQGPP